MLDPKTAERAKELQRQYVREWRQRNRDKVKSYNARYWMKKAEQEERDENAETVSTE